MRNPLLTDGQKLQSLSAWKKELRGYCIEREDINYNVLNHNLDIKMQLFNVDTLPRKDYICNYRQQKRFKKIEGIRISEVAKIKFTNRQTVYNHLQKFDIIPGTSPLSIKFNNKIFNWNPLKG